MTLDALPSLQTPAIGRADGPAVAATPDTADFRRLLESLEKLTAEHQKAQPVQDATGLQEAITRADAGFTTAMDLRRQLEAAFRARTP